MKLWLLRPVGYEGEYSEPGAWAPWYDKAFGFVVRANTEAEARAFAQKEAGDETRKAPDAWLSADHSTCVRLTVDGDPGVILRDFQAA